MYSLMSMRIMAFSSSNRNSASARDNSVLPTPVGPRKMKEPIGRFSSCNPARARRTALETATIACVLSDDALHQALFHLAPASPARPPANARRECASSSRRLRRCLPRSLPRAGVAACRSPFLSRSAQRSLRSSSGIRPYCNSLALANSPRRCARSSSVRGGIELLL